MRKGLFGERVEQLNRAVQTDVAKHLFLVCNYRAIPAVATNANARFFAWIQELYKVAVDCGDLVRNLHHIVPSQVCPTNTQLHALVEEKVANQVKVIVMLRSMFDHNNCIDGGYEQQAQLVQYESWMKRRISKPVPETEEDYEILDRVMQRFAEDLYNNLKCVIACIGALPVQEKRTIIKNWEWQILRWYARPYGNVYYGHLAMVYISKATAARGSEFAFRDDEEKSRCIEQWIAEKLREEYLPVIREKEKLIEYLGPLPKLLEQLEAAQESLKSLEKKIEKEGGDKKVFLKALPVQLRQTMRICKCSMLPQELILEDIERCFASVSAPDFGTL